MVPNWSETSSRRNRWNVRTDDVRRDLGSGSQGQWSPTRHIFRYPRDDTPVPFSSTSRSSAHAAQSGHRFWFGRETEYAPKRKRDPYGDSDSETGGHSSMGSDDSDESDQELLVTFSSQEEDETDLEEEIEAPSSRCFPMDCVSSEEGSDRDGGSDKPDSTKLSD